MIELMAESSSYVLLYRENKLPRVDKFIISEYQEERIMGRIYANLSHSGD